MLPPSWHHLQEVRLLFSFLVLEDIPFLIMSNDRVDALRKSVIGILRSVFDRNVQGNSYNKYIYDYSLIYRKLVLVLKCYVLLDMVEDIQNYYRENFIIPFIDTIITRVYTQLLESFIGKVGWS